MKALTFKNPWAYLIAWGIKDIENRSTRTKKEDVRIYIHTSLTWDKKNNDLLKLFTKRQWGCLNLLMEEEYLLARAQMITGAIIGEITIVDCVEDHSSIWAEPGMYHWRLKDPVLYDKPILNVKGKQSFFEFTP